MRHTFKVYERLKREQHINTLFRTGKAFSVFPVKCLYRIFEGALAEKEGANVQVGFSVPKKKFRQSVQRHRIRRLMAEAWRLKKHTLSANMPPGYVMHVFLIFIDTAQPDYDIVDVAVQAGVKKLSETAKQAGK